MRTNSVNRHGLRPLVAMASAAVLCFASASHAQTTYYATLTLRNVMAGQSSGGNDQTWIRVDGQPAGVPADCVWTNFSLFYVTSASPELAPDKALSLAISAKLAAQPVMIAFVVDSGQSDFWGWGYTHCRIVRMVMGS